MNKTFRNDLFAGKVALVSGGTSGIGAAVAQRLAELGATVTVTGPTAHDIEESPHATGVRAIVLDVRDGSAVAACAAGFSQLDVLVNCAGIIRRAAEHDPLEFAAVVDVNLTGTMRLATAARPLLARASGCIVNLASMFSFFGGPHAPGYTASKGGVAQLTKALAAAYAVDGIRVNAVAPGWIATPMTQPVRDDPQKSAAIIARTPMGRFGDATEVAQAIVFLCSPAAAFITGAILPVDGGYLIC